LISIDFGRSKNEFLEVAQNYLLVGDSFHLNFTSTGFSFEQQSTGTLEILTSITEVIGCIVWFRRLE
jgi:hypothetical protein